MSVREESILAEGGFLIILCTRGWSAASQPSTPSEDLSRNQLTIVIDERASARHLRRVAWLVTEVYLKEKAKIGTYCGSIHSFGGKRLKCAALDPAADSTKYRLTKIRRRVFEMVGA
jgi:hypothetical protein